LKRSKQTIENSVISSTNTVQPLDKLGVVFGVVVHLPGVAPRVIVLFNPSTSSGLLHIKY